MTTGKFARQPIWESSRRPLYPKCVWIESIRPSAGGHRHFIFDHDIQKQRQEFTTSSETSSHQSFAQRNAYSCDLIEDDMESLKLIGLADVAYERRVTNNLDSTISTPQRPHTRTTQKSLSLIKKQLNDRFPGDTNKAFSDDDNAIKTNQTIHANDNKNNSESDSSKNPLAERVLQWLDLAGKATINRIESEHKKLANSQKRRISTATEVNERKSSIPNETMAVQVRRDSVHHLSLTFNEEDTYLAQMKGSCETPINERVSLRFGEFFPTTYRCSRKFLSLRHGSAKNLIVNAETTLASLDSTLPNKNDNFSGKKLMGNKKLNKAKFKKFEQIEGQYRAMIQRQILETSCNTQLAKRQLHIFMPNLPKKGQTTAAVTNSKDNSAGDCDSCISTVLSSSV